METAGKEVEIKLRVGNLVALRRALARLGAKPLAAGGAGKRGLAAGRAYEFNTLFDTPDGGLAKHGQLLRIRTETPCGRRAGAAKRPRTVFTYKGPSVEDSAASAALHRRYKVREEFEVEVADPGRLRQILEALGLRGWFRYEKYRTTYRLPSRQRWAADLHLQLDETPIGSFLELEGPPEAIDRATQLLGYRPADCITKSYLALWLEQARREGKPVGDLLFPKAAGVPVAKKNRGERQSFLDKATYTL